MFNKLVVCAMLLLGAAVDAHSQAYTSYSPYTLYGVGDLMMPGNAYSRTMAGVGVAGRSNRFINIINPAAITARDSLSFMADVSIYGDNRYSSQGSIKSASNTFNVLDCAIQFPIYKSLTAMFGIMPYSSTGYGYEMSYTDPEIISRTGNISFSATGSGAIYKGFATLGVDVFRGLSVGAQAIYYFGSIVKSSSSSFSDSSYNSFSNGQNLQLNAFSGKFGVQYSQPIGNKDKIILGATYTMKANLKGYIEDYSYSVGSAAVDTLYHRIDTLSHNPGRVKLAGELAVGVSYRHADKWMVEFDFTTSNWAGTGLDTTPGFKGNDRQSSTTSVFSATRTNAYRLGFEIVPNRNDIRYYHKKIEYRGGAYYKNEYYMLDGHAINAMGLTFGVTFPINRGYNGLTVGVDVGQRGSTTGQLIKEKYFGLTFAANLYDRWFHKQRYE